MSRNLQLKKAKAAYKTALQNLPLYIQKRNETLQYILSSRTPKWGSLIIKQIKY